MIKVLFREIKKDFRRKQVYSHHTIHVLDTDVMHKRLVANVEAPEAFLIMKALKVMADTNPQELATFISADYSEYNPDDTIMGKYDEFNG